MSWQQFKQAWLVKFWAPVPAVIAAGILSTYYFGITGTFWAVTGEFTRWGGQILQLFGVHAEEWGYLRRHCGPTTLNYVCRAAVSALCRRLSAG